MKTEIITINNKLYTRITRPADHDWIKEQSQEILKQLVELHKYKQENGATEYYETKKAELWDKAYKAVGIEDEIL